MQTRFFTVFAALPAILTLSTAVSAQEVGGWEFRAGLERVAAGVCSTSGACFGITCTAAGGWDPAWFAEVEVTAEGTVPDPILAIRTEGTDAARFALTALSGAGIDGPIRRYEGEIATADTALLDALQAGEGVTVDPGRDFALAEFALRGSRWAITEALDLCAEGGPDVSNAIEDDAG